MREIAFRVNGAPVPKQSYRHSKHGGYQPARVKAWETAVGWYAKQAMGDKPPITGPVIMTLDFVLDHDRRMDCVNLAKPVEDAMNGIVYIDDRQVVDLHITKTTGWQPGVDIEVIEQGT